MILGRVLSINALLVLLFCAVVASAQEAELDGDPLPACESLLAFQYDCTEPPAPWPENSVEGCQPDNTMTVACFPLAGVECTGPRTFTRQVPCRHTNGYSYSTALGLSVMLGNFGIDRFYLGYPVAGIIKLLSCGFFVIGNLVDITLIATQALGPADGSEYEVEEGLPVLSAWPVTCQTRVDIATFRNGEL